MLYQILKQCSPTELDATDDTEIPEELKQLLKDDKPEAELETSQQKLKRRLVLKNKI